MQADLKDSIKNTSAGKEAERILRACVHCGFCTATCPTYRLLGDELDGPRGRIYLIKSMLEGKPATAKTLQHLDRCLTCRSCETTCPSGVEYGKLLDVGRHYAEQQVERSLFDKFFRGLLLRVLPYRKRFSLLLKLGRTFRPILPAALKKQVPVAVKTTFTISGKQHERKVLLLSGCVQPSLAPSINAATRLLLDRLGVAAIEIDAEQCCGALGHHLNATGQARDFMRANIDAMTSIINEQGIEAIISTASGCGVHLKDYGYHFREDPEYFDKAQQVALLTKDIAEFIQDNDLSKLEFTRADIPIAFQSPCTLQHGQKLTGVVEDILQRLGCRLVPVDNAYLCCGSAGVYSLLQTTISQQVKQEKLKTLLQNDAELILTANIGCLVHLDQSSPVPVRHWAEYIASRISE
ncbi:MAG: glycolate oxidase subunit GlcF [Gammaproteobacteria bacterium]